MNTILIYTDKCSDCYVSFQSNLRKEVMCDMVDRSKNTVSLQSKGKKFYERFVKALILYCTSQENLLSLKVSVRDIPAKKGMKKNAEKILFIDPTESKYFD